MKRISLNPKIEVWGGIECTCNRVSDTYFDQLQYTGHYERDEDIDLFANLGISRMRYPILWKIFSQNQIRKLTGWVLKKG